MQKSVDSSTNIGHQIIDWYQQNKRDLPWRHTQDPYKIWLSEIILQQTRVAQGMAYYEKFVKHYPTVTDLANASEDAVMKDWQGLGYYSRARNLHAAAKHIQSEHEGTFPQTYHQIRELKGVGDYTAAAISSFAYNLEHAVLDGNVFRLSSRYFGIETPIDASNARKIFLPIIQSMMPEGKAADFNQAIMEFGALQCVPKNPNCNRCPLANQCYAKAENKIDQLPIKKNKIKQRKRYFNYLLIEDGNSTMLRKREEKGIWQNLYEFPLIETTRSSSQASLLKNKEFTTLFKDENFNLVNRSEERKHILSHQIILARFYHLKVQDISRVNTSNYKAIDLDKLENFAIPKLLENYLREETNFISLFSN